MSEYIYGTGEQPESPLPPNEPTEATADEATAHAPEATAHVYMDPPASPVPPLPPEHKSPKKHRGASAAVVAVICAVCVLLSGGAGYLGASWAVSKNSDGTGVQPSGSSATQMGGTTVIYRDVSTVTDSTGSGNTVASVSAAVKNSVVEITTEETVNSSFFQYVQSGAGSGVIVSEDGFIVTCNHVIASSSGSGYVSTINVTLADGTVYPATLVGADSDTDVAVLKIDATGLTFAVIGNSAQLVVGESIVVVGNPLGELGGSVSSGIVSATSREVTVENNVMTLVQVDAAVNPGNSGGGLFNLNGALIGIVNAKYSQSGIEGLGFAIPIDTAWHVAEQLMEYGYVRGRVVVGISVREVTDAQTAYNLYRRRSAGVYIDSATEKYNGTLLQRGDRIIAINGQEITSSSEVISIIQGCEVDDKIDFTVSRANGASSEIITVSVTCYEYVPEGINVGSDS